MRLRRAGSLQAVRALLRRGADPEVRDARGCTPLMQAAARGYAHVISELIRAGADPKRTCRAGSTMVLEEQITKEYIPDVQDLEQYYNYYTELDHDGDVDGERYLRSEREVAAVGEPHTVGEELEDEEEAYLLNSTTAYGGQVCIKTTEMPGNRVYAWNKEHVDGADDDNDPYLEHWRNGTGWADRDQDEDGDDPESADPSLQPWRSQAYEVGGWTALHFAAWQGHARAAGVLLEAGAHVDATSAAGAAPLHLAVRRGHQPVLRALLRAGADVEAADGDGTTPLMAAAGAGDVRTLEPLLQHGADPNRHYMGKAEARETEDEPEGHQGDGHAEPPEAAAPRAADDWSSFCGWRDTEFYGAEADEAEDEDETAERSYDHSKAGWTALHFAVSRGHVAAADALLRAGADVDAADWEGCTALHVAASHGQVAAAEALVRAGADKDAPNRNGWVPLHEAVSRGDAEVAGALLDAGAAPDGAVHAGADTPLMLCVVARSRDFYTARLLLEAGANVDAVGPTGYTVLGRVIEEGGDLVTVRFLLEEAGADVTARMESGATPLHLAARCGNTAVARELLQWGARADETDQDGWTPLHAAALSGNPPVLRELLRAGADKEARTRGPEGQVRTPLHVAAGAGNVETLRELLQAGAEREARNVAGRTALHLAALVVGRRGKRGAESVRALVQAGARVDAADEDGRTPLHLAAEAGRLPALRALLAAGADLQARDKLGCTPLILAVRSNQEEAAQVLL